MPEGFFRMNILPNLTHSISKIPQAITHSEFPLSHIQVKQFEGVQKGIPLFDGVNYTSLKDIAFITKKLETLNLFRGCNVGCTHCLKNSIPLLTNLSSILFEDLIKFINGFKELNERLGFNILNGNKYLNIIDDSNPSDIPIISKNGEKHSVVECIQKIYDGLNIPVLFVTSGWSKNSKYAQNSSEELVRIIEHNPRCVTNVQI